MDEQLESEQIPQQSGSRSKTPLILSIFAILAIVVIFILFKTKDSTSTTLGVSVTPNVPIESNTEVIDNVRTFEITSGMFYFDPKEIRVKEGETVRIVSNNTEGKHDFVIDEFSVRTKVLEDVESDEVVFRASQIGEFEYYCSIGDHRAMGMVGKLIVE